MNTSKKRYGIFRRIIGAIFAMLLLGFGMACIYYANLGSDPITTLIDGIMVSFNLGEGKATTILNVVFFIFMFLFNRKNIQAATLISVLFLGPFMNVSLTLLETLLPKFFPILGRLSLTIAGSGILGIAIGLYLSFDLGSTPPDSVPLWIRDKFQIQFQYSVWIFYSVCLITGFLLGGKLGFGTITAFIIVGPIADFVMRKFIISKAEEVYENNKLKETNQTESMEIEK